MTKSLLPLLIFTFFSFNLFSQAPFITTWETTSSNESITIPTSSNYEYSYSIDWGDGSSASNVTGNITHEYTTAGLHTVSISGEFPAIYFSGASDNSKIKTIEQWGDIEWESMDRAFQSCSNLVSVATDSPDLSIVESCMSMFNGATNFTGDLNNWDVSNVTDMSYMFLGTSKFNSDLDQWTTSNVSNMNSMFYEATAFNGDISTWDVQNVTNMVAMFSYAENFNRNIGNWNTASLDNFVFIFNSAKSFNQPIGNWDVSRITDMRAIFYRALDFNQSLHNWDVSSVTDMSEMFGEAESFNSDISSWDVSNVTSMTQMFYVARSFDQDISGWDISKVQDVRQMFYFAESFNQDLTAWDVSHLTNMNSMFASANAFNGDITTWDVSNVVDMASMFSSANSFNQDISQWDVSSVSTMNSMFWGATVFNQDISSWDVGRVRDASFMLAGTDDFNQDISSWDLSTVVSTRGMFLDAAAFNQDIGGWDVSNVTNMKRMFENAQVFNGDINNWDVGKVNDFSSMFERANTFNQSLNNWDVSSATNMVDMFSSASSFNGDVSSWDVNGVTSFRYMFSNASAFAKDLSLWNVANATNMDNMFLNASSFNSDLSQWDLSGVISMRDMFRNATVFDQSLENWNVSNVTNFGIRFLNATNLSVENYDATLQAWAALDNLATGVNFYASNLKYCAGEASRSQLVSDKSWSFYFDSKQCGNITPSSIELATSSIEEGSSAGSIVGILSTLDQNEGDTHTYQLVTGTGDTDNATFVINGDQVEISEVPDYAAQSSYSIRVQANDGNGGLLSKVFTIKVVQSNSLSLTAIGSKIYGDPDFELQATSNSPQTISYRSSDNSIALVYGNRVEIKAAGTVMIYAAQEEGSEFSAAGVSQELVIGKATQQIIHQLPSSINYQDRLSFSANNDNGLPISFSSSNSSKLSVYGDAGVEYSDVSIILEPLFDAEDVAWRLSKDGMIIEESDPLGQYFFGKSTKTIRLPNGTYDFLLYNPGRAEITIKKDGETIYNLDEIRTNITYDFEINNDTKQEVVATGSGPVNVEINSEGNGNYLPAQLIHPLTINKLDQTIDFPAISNKTYGDPTFELEASSNTDLPIVFSSSDENVASIEGSTVTIHNAGTASITAQQAGSDNYNAATNVVRTLTVNKASQTIAFASLPDKEYGDESFALATTSSSGLEVSFSSSSPTVATITDNMVTILTAGFIDIQASQSGNENYQPATSVSRTLRISKIRQTLDLEPVGTKRYGDTPFALNATTSADLPVTFSSGDESIFTVNDNVVTIVGSGSTNLIVSQPGNVNYIGFTSYRSFTVSKANQTIIFDPIPDKTYGEDSFELNAKGGESGNLVQFSSLDESVATIQGNMVSIVGAGTANIVATQSGNENYNAAGNSFQELTVNKADQSISFDALSNKIYGEPAFELEATTDSGLSISFESSDESVATVSGNSVSIGGVGIVNFTASQSGNENYEAATEVVQEVVVNKAAQSILFDALANKAYGDASFELTGNSDSGLPIIYESSDETVATVTDNTVTILGGGTTTITASQSGNENYLAANDIVQELSVNKATQSISFDALPSKTYGDPSFELTAISDSGLPVIYESSDETIALVSGNVVSVLSAGTIDITAIQAGNGNYEAATEVVKELVIEKANQTISFDTFSDRTYGDMAFEVKANTDSGLDVSFSSSDEAVASVSGNTITILGAGTTIITASQSGSNEYNAANEVSQELIVNKADQEITIEEIADKEIGNADFKMVASTTSQLDLTYTIISGPATVEGNVVRLTDAPGLVEIEVSQSGNMNFNSAIATISFEVIEPCLDFSASAVQIQNVSCAGDSNGSFEITVSEGIAPFTYSIGSESQESGLFENVSAGSYEITVSDANGCSAVSTVEITEPQTLEVTAEITDSNSINGNGSISLTVTGGTGNYSYEWGNGETTAILSDLEIGEYSVTVTDEADCSLTETYAIGGVTANTDAFQLKVYPNPVTDQVKLIHGEKVNQISLIDANGKIILQQKPSGKESQLEMKGLPSATYFILLDNGKMKRIIKK